MLLDTYWVILRAITRSTVRSTLGKKESVAAKSPNPEDPRDSFQRWKTKRLGVSMMLIWARCGL